MILGVNSPLLFLFRRNVNASRAGCVKGSLEEAAGHAALLSAALPGRQAGRPTAGEGEGEGWHERACGWVGRCAESML